MERLNNDSRRAYGRVRKVCINSFRVRLTRCAVMIIRDVLPVPRRNSFLEMLWAYAEKMFVYFPHAILL